jgi:hypothetical protein
LGLGQNEAQFVNVSALPDPSAVIAYLYAHESHPPFFYLIGHLFASLGAPVVAAMSLLVLVTSVGVIAATWWLGSLSGRRWPATIAALLVGWSVPQIIYSVQLRPYALVSLLLLLSTGALVQGLQSGRWIWKAAWAAELSVLLYLHHLGMLVAGAEVAALGLISMRRHMPPRELRRWALWCGIVAALALPDLVMLAHQAKVAGYPVPITSGAFRPFEIVVRLCRMFPAELLLAVCASFALAWRWAIPTYDTAPDQLRGVVSLTFTFLLLLLIGATYRSTFLTADVALAISPLGAVSVGLVVTDLLVRGRRVMAACWLEAIVLFSAVSIVLHAGFAKTNIDLMASYINAEARADDAVLVVPGGIAASFNRFLDRPLSQIDYPFMGRLKVYPYDHEFERMAALQPLHAVLDTLAGACEQGRRVWFVFPAPWRLSNTAPAQLSRAEFGGSIQSSWARASYLHDAVMAQFGAPVRMADSSTTSHGMEMAHWELFGPVGDRISGAAPVTCGRP